MSKLLPEETYSVVGVGDVRPSPTNPRKSFDEAGLADLAKSIAQHGILQTIVVRPVGPTITFDKKAGWECDHFEIVAGERRWRAAKLAGLTEIQVKVKPLTHDQVLELQLVENDQREDVKPSEQAAAYKRLADAVGLAAAAERTGRSEAAVRGWCKLARCPAELAAAVDAGRVGRSVAELVSGVGGEGSRMEAAACVLLGLMTPHSLPGQGDDGDDWLDEIRAVADGCRPDATPLGHRETKELIAKHFQRETGKAPFPTKKPLDLLPGVPSCQECPKRAGNLAKLDPKLDPEFVGVRADICTDPDCYSQKVEAYRRGECERFGRKHGIVGPVEPVAEPWRGDHPPKGYCDLADVIRASELNTPESPWGGKKGEQTVADVLAGAAGWEKNLPKLLAFDGKGKPRTLVRTADVRKRLIGAGLMSKPEKPAAKGNVGTRPVAGELPAQATAVREYKLYRLVMAGQLPPVEFDALDGETEEELNDKARLALISWLEDEVIDWLGYELVPEAETNTVQPAEGIPAPAGPKDIDELLRLSLLSHVAGSEEIWKPLQEGGATSAQIKAVLNRIWTNGGSSGPGYQCTFTGGGTPTWHGSIGDTIPTKLSAPTLLDRIRYVLDIPLPQSAEAQASAPGPIVCKPVGEGLLSHIKGISESDAQVLAQVGLKTLFDLEAAAEEMRKAKPRSYGAGLGAVVYDVLKQHPGSFAPAVVLRIGDAVLDHLGHAAAKKIEAEEAAKSPAKPKKRKAVLA